MNLSLSCRWPSLALAVAALSAAALAQPAATNAPTVPGGAAPTNTVETTESAAADAATTPADDTQANPTTGSEELSDTNAAGADGLQKSARSGNRSDVDGRQSRKRRFDRQAAERGNSSTGPGTPAATDSAASKLDYNSFRLIVERNIFNPNRAPHRAGAAAPPPKRTDYVSLVGIMSYEKGEFAFFSGTSSSYEKAAKVADSIADYKVTEINSLSNSVKLAAGTNRLEMLVGMSLRRDDGGEWSLSHAPAAYTAATASAASPDSTASSTTGTASSADDNDVIKRMMQRRQQQ